MKYIYEFRTIIQLETVSERCSLKLMFLKNKQNPLNVPVNELVFDNNTVKSQQIY